MASSDRLSLSSSASATGGSRGDVDDQRDRDRQDRARGAGPGDLLADGPLAAAVAGTAGAVLEDLGFALVRVHRVGGGDRPTVEVMVERAGGDPVGVDDCARISRDLAVALDAAEALPGAYTLQVSSPGIERPLTRPEDFRRFAGERARLELREPIAGRRRFTGRLAGIEDGADDGGTVLLRPSADDGAAEVENADAPLRLPFAGLARARLVVEAAVPSRPKAARGAGKAGKGAAARDRTSRGRSRTARGGGSGDEVAGMHGRPDEAAGTR